MRGACGWRSRWLPRVRRQEERLVRGASNVRLRRGSRGSVDQGARRRGRRGRGSGRGRGRRRGGGGGGGGVIMCLVRKGLRMGRKARACRGGLGVGDEGVEGMVGGGGEDEQHGVEHGSTQTRSRGTGAVLFRHRVETQDDTPVRVRAPDSVRSRRARQAETNGTAKVRTMRCLHHCCLSSHESVSYWVSFPTSSTKHVPTQAETMN